MPYGAIEVCQRRRSVQSWAEAARIGCCSTVVADGGGFNKPGSLFTCKPGPASAMLKGAGDGTPSSLDGHDTHPQCPTSGNLSHSRKQQEVCACWLSCALQVITSAVSGHGAGSEALKRARAAGTGNARGGGSRQEARIDANCFSCGTIGRTFATFMLAIHSAILQPVAFPHRRVEVVLLHAANNERHAPLTPLR